MPRYRSWHQPHSLGLCCSEHLRLRLSLGCSLHVGTRYSLQLGLRLSLGHGLQLCLRDDMCLHLTYHSPWHTTGD